MIDEFKNDFPDIQKSRVKVERTMLGLLDLPVEVVVEDIQDIWHPVAIRNFFILFKQARHLEFSKTSIDSKEKKQSQFLRSSLNGSLPYYVANKTTEDWEGRPGSSESQRGLRMEQKFSSEIVIDY